MKITEQSEVQSLLRYPLLEAISRRRTRRFPVGCNLDVGTTKHQSQKPATPLNETEHAVLCWSGAGVTGIIASDLQTPGMGNTYCSWVGKATAMPCSYPTSKLFFTNDDGIFLYDPKEATKVVEIDTDDEWNKILEQYQGNTVKVQSGRLGSGDGVLSHMKWNTNKPGTTVFMPIIDLTAEYINLLFGCFQGEGYQMIDDRTGKAAGIQKWIDKGVLNGPPVPLSSIEYLTYNACIGPSFMQIQNMQVVAEAMGLGSIPMAGYQGMIMLGGTDMADGLGFDFATDKNGIPFCTGLKEHYETYCPPFKSIDQAVEDFYTEKFGTCGLYDLKHKGPQPFKEKEDILPGYETVTEQTVEITKDYCNYIYDTYGRFPLTYDPIVMPMWLQIHHLDVDWYDKYQIDGIINENIRQHLDKWHK
jgi:hypothetical protein